MASQDKKWIKLKVPEIKYAYIGRLKSGSSIGINTKLIHTCEAIRSHGRQCRIDIASSGGIRSVFKFIQAAAAADEDVLIIRSDHFSMLAMAPVLILKRLTGKIIILDVANPVCVAYHETWARSEPLLKRLFMMLILLVSYPLAFIPAHRIQQYGFEGKLASLGVNHKIALIGNAANTHTIPIRRRIPEFDGRSLVFGMAGHIAYFHGVDRFLKSMAQYRLSGGDCDIRLKIIGDGFEIASLKELARKLDLGSNVEFLDAVPLQGLEEFFESVHIGLCNLAQHRKGIFLNSDLKSRDMAARGLPFILAIEDPDFSRAKLSAVYTVPNDESLLDFDAIKTWFATIEHVKRAELRNFAETTLDFNSKVKEIMKFSEGKLIL